MAEAQTTIGQLAAAAGVNVETVRYYQRIKLMPVPKKAPRGIRRYGASDLARLRFIKTAQGLGFTLDEVAELIKLDDGMRCTEAHDIAQHKLTSVRARLRDLRRMEQALARLVRRCAAQRGAIRCPLIDTLQKAE
ncbi:MAG: Hg(II)-responsive transcriptional regulator [Pseudomonadota bacterium]|nr:MAG: Hg(II)-responsive transcriptional regulator [Pseudomonadota bacterium]